MVHLQPISAAISAACETWGVSVSDILSYRRTENVAWARAVVMTAGVDQYGFSVMQMSRMFDRHHGTILHARRKVYGMAGIYPNVASELRQFLQSLRRFRELEAGEVSVTFSNAPDVGTDDGSFVVGGNRMGGGVA